MTRELSGMEKDIIEDIKSVAVTTIEQDAANVDKTYDETAELRKRITTKVMSAVDKTEIQNYDDPDTIHAKMAIYNSASNILNDTNKSALDRAKLKVKLKDMENADADRKEVVAAIREISLNKAKEAYVPVNDEELDEEIMKRVVEEDIGITEGELLTSHKLSAEDDPMSKEIEAEDKEPV